MNKTFNKDLVQVKINRNFSLIVSVISLVFGVLTLALDLIVQTRDNIVITTIVFMILSIIFFSIFGYLFFYKKNVYKNYIKLASLSQGYNRKLKLVKINKKPFYENYLLFVTLIFEDEKKNQIELKLLSSNFNDFVTGVTYRLKIVNNIVFEYEKA